MILDQPLGEALGQAVKLDKPACQEPARRKCVLGQLAG